jgi:hypothetical protein
MGPTSPMVVCSCADSSLYRAVFRAPGEVGDDVRVSREGRHRTVGPVCVCVRVCVCMCVYVCVCVCVYVHVVGPG